MPYIYRDTKPYNNYKEMWNLTRNELPEKCLQTAGFRMDDEANLYNMAERIEALHKTFGNDGDYGAYHIVIEYSSFVDVNFRRLDEMIAVNYYLKDFYRDHQIAYGIFVNGKKVELHCIIDAMNMKTGEMCRVEDDDLIKFCCWCRRNRRDPHLRPVKRSCANQEE